MNKSVFIDLSKDENPQHADHEYSTQIQFELSPMTEPGAQYIDYPAGQKPERQQIDILFAQVIYIKQVLPPSLFSRKQKKASNMIKVWNPTARASFEVCVNRGAGPLSYSFLVMTSQSHPTLYTMIASIAKQYAVMTMILSSWEKVLICLWLQNIETKGAMPPSAVQFMNSNIPCQCHQYPSRLQLLLGSKQVAGYGKFAPLDLAYIIKINLQFSWQRTERHRKEYIGLDLISMLFGAIFSTTLQFLSFQKMNKTVQLERKSAELNSDIQDILHAATLNFKALYSQTQHESIDTLKEEFSYLESMLESIRKLIQNRTPLFMSYLITRQIQEEEGRVRRERLVEYEEKIYDQKRIITDKETFFQSLLRPKRKRPSYQTVEEFQEIRAREREAEENMKLQKLTKDATELKSLKKWLENSEILKKKLQLQYTKSSSISQVNMSIVEGETATQRVIPFEDRSNKTSRPVHMRATSMQHEFTKQNNSFKKQKEDIEQQIATAKNVVKEIQDLKQKNEQLHKIYDQAHASLKFKQEQCKRVQNSYKLFSSQIVDTKKQVFQAKKRALHRNNRVYSPVGSLQKRSASP